MENRRENVMTKFDEIASKYDEQRKKLIPCFDDFYSIAVSVAKAANDSPNILDVGAGTGLLSAFILEKYPQANVTLIDISEKMLEVAKVRFEKYQNVTYIVDDYTKHDFTEKFDVVISSLSIHHLTGIEKKGLYERIFSWLKADGVFVNADQVLGSTPYIDELYKTDWKQKVESSGMDRHEIISTYERTKLDKMSTLNEQLDWLKEAGFSDADCVYKYFNFVVLYGRKLAD
ncbi:tRNA (cmo5U34)-methyltransferase [Aneurinibacillus soli]|uniref:Ubiquinone/menaquinone biosynthesis methyltransferase n=1 Tax=Aneurinibacillus soli TaxID=1500254 RepID=A0A0U4WEZ6_9BACL|nr:class I SAM-dependent methyltransferase [Aneurinibacillus soli]PYE60311.1 tRNA (cmo5U34)-methyltransferase [Aneurinibacillus soli]BAU27289.1 ubiquinone/menaquinone biosynthesis methyltransferase [Aneurinibacillus soli]